MNADNHLRVGLIGYYKSFRGWPSVLAAVATPYVSKLAGPDWGAYLFPPLGSVDVIARLGLVCLGVGLSLGVYYLAVAHPRKSPSRWIWIALVLTLFSLLSYLVAYQTFVRRVDVPSSGIVLDVSVGYQRTPFASQTFGTASDWEMLRARGTREEDIQQLWTAESLIIARLSLYLSYALIVLSLLFAVSFGVAQDMSQPERG